MSTPMQLLTPSLPPSSKRSKLEPAPNHKPNIGGASKMKWFNQLVDNPQLRPALNNLFTKIDQTEAMENGCLQVKDKDERFRPQVDKRFREEASKVCPELPERFAPYHISLARNGRRVPTTDPPPYPPELRKVKDKRTSTAASGNEKEACWVASHLCHNRRCIRPEHLEWEPSWMNRLRDNCPGGDACIHRPKQ